MKLYRVVWSTGSVHVEAKAMGEAVRIWREEMQKQWRRQVTVEEEPDEVVLVDAEGGAFRERPKIAAGAPGDLRSLAKTVVDAWMDDADLADAIVDRGYPLAAAMADLKAALEAPVAGV